MPVIIESYDPPRRFTPWIHKAFALIYLLLVSRFFLTVYEGPRFRSPSLGTQLLRRSSGILIQPCYVIFSGGYQLGIDLHVAIIMALAMYVFIHYGMIMNVSTDGRVFMADRILKACKALFFLLGTLLLLLIVLRMGVMLYQDLTFERMIIGVPAAK